MRVLVEQQFHPGHFYQWVSHLLPALLQSADEVVVAVTPGGLRSPEFTSFLAPFAPRVRFEPVLPAADPALPLRERLQVHDNLRRAVRQIAPDYVLIPSGDAETTAMSFFRWTGRGCLPDGVPCEVGIHYGAGRSRDWLQTLNFALSGVRRIHIVNHLYYEQIRSMGPAGRRFTLVPSPVVRHLLTKQEARRRLGLPENGRYIGLAASIDFRKAVREFLAAFRDASSDPSDRVLLAGWIHDHHKRTIEAEFGDLVKSDRIILRHGFMLPEDFRAAVSAMDVVCAPYPGFRGLSNTLLEAVAAGRPVLADDSGWSRAMVRCFGVGWRCNVLDHEQFTQAIRVALDRAGEYQETEPIRRLLAFHSPENFGRSWVEGIRRSHHTEAADAMVPLSWDWVAESLPAGQRRLAGGADAR